MSVRPLHDCILIELEPEKEKASESGIIIVSGPEPIRFAKVLATGPGRKYKDRFVPTQVQVGDRVAFFMANLETKQGAAICHRLEENHGLIRESDILMVVDEDVRISV